MIGCIFRRIPGDVCTVKDRCDCRDSGVKMLECVVYYQVWPVSFVPGFKTNHKIKWTHRWVLEVDAIIKSDIQAEM